MKNFNALSKTEDARKGFRSWAKDFRKKLKRIDEGKKPKQTRTLDQQVVLRDTLTIFPEKSLPSS